MKFSIIVPVYNAEAFLRDSVESLRRQSCPDWEAIFVDDGSTDESLRILNSYAQMDGRIKVIHQENSGVASARNLGIEIASGEYFGFLDADDVYASNVLLEAGRIFDEDCEVGLVTVGLKQFRTHGDISVSAGCFQVAEKVDVRFSLPSRFMRIGFCQTFYRRNVYGDIRFPPYIVGEDRTYTAICLSRTTYLSVSDYVGYWYRQHSGSVTKGRETIRKTRDRILYLPHIVRVLLASGKCIDPNIYIEFLKIWIYDIPGEVWRYLRAGTKDSAELRSMWVDSLPLAMKLPGVSILCRMQLRTVICLRSVLVAYVLLTFPRDIYRLTRRFLAS